MCGMASSDASGSGAEFADHRLEVISPARRSGYQQRDKICQVSSLRIVWESEKPT